MENPAIYVADLAAYNNGILHGVWIDATKDIADIWQKENNPPFLEGCRYFAFFD